MIDKTIYNDPKKFHNYISHEFEKFDILFEDIKKLNIDDLLPVQKLLFE